MSPYTMKNVDLHCFQEAILNLFFCSVLLTTLLTSLLIGCGEAAPYPPERPSELPGSAVWQGGLDGGNWIDCVQREADLKCRVYWQSGELYSEQSFRLCYSSNPSEWIGSPFGEGLNDVSVESGLTWSPISPAIFFDGEGTRDEAIYEKYAQLFVETASDRCISK